MSAVVLFYGYYKEKTPTGLNLTVLWSSQLSVRHTRWGYPHFAFTLYIWLTPSQLSRRLSFQPVLCPLLHIAAILNAIVVHTVRCVHQRYRAVQVAPPDRISVGVLFEVVGYADALGLQLLAAGGKASLVSVAVCNVGIGAAEEALSAAVTRIRPVLQHRSAPKVYEGRTLDRLGFLLSGIAVTVLPRLLIQHGLYLAAA